MLRFKVYSIIIMLLVVGAQQMAPCCIELKSLSQNCNAESPCCHDTDTKKKDSCCETEDDSQQCCTCLDSGADDMYYVSFEHKGLLFCDVTTIVVFLTIKRASKVPFLPILPPINILQQSCTLLC